jgi:PKD repeat protein
MKKITLLLLTITITALSYGQNWVDVFLDETKSFDEKKAAYDAFYAGKDKSQLKGWKHFERWAYNFKRRAQHQEENYRQINQRALEEFNNNANNALSNARSGNGMWTFIGPSSLPTGGGGAGRVACVEWAPNGDLLIGAPAGGLWRRSGTTWNTATDFSLNYLGFSDILVNSANPNLIIAASGDADAGDAQAIGVIKSIDGGLTWVSIGLNNASRIYKILALSADFNTLLVSTNLGVYYTNNGGNTWSQPISGSGTVHDMEQKPNDPNTIYAVTSNGFFISNNGGVSFSNVASSVGLPTTGINRRAIAVTPGDANYIYLLHSRSDNSGLHSVYRSIDGGSSFTMMINGVSGTLNLLGWSSTGNDVSSGGQGWYDLSIAAHPTSPNTVFVGGVNIWRSLDAGATWAISGHWTGSGGAPYVHADIHSLDFRANGDLYACCDGGLFINTNPNGTPGWTDLSSGLHIAQMYRIGASQTNDGLLLTGWQDNGTNLRNSSTSNWRRVMGGDGFESAIDPTNANNMYGEVYYGDIDRSTNGGTSFSNIVQSNGTAGTVNEKGPWLTNFVIAKSNPTIMYVGKSNVYKSTTSGVGGASSWLSGTGIPSSGSIGALAVSPSNADYVYASKGNAIYVATDGQNFSLKSTGLPGNTITYIAIGSTPTTAFVTVNGGSGNKVYKTVNGGDSWTNISGNLPNVSPQCIVVDEVKPYNQLYIGHLNGVYYTNDTLTAGWVTFDNGLPNTEVTELEIQYSTAKLKAGTYGRGAWESDLYSPTVVGPCTAPPTANFVVNSTSVCPATNVIFTNTTLSCTATTTYNWSFPGGTPATSTAKDPVIQYTTPGVYSVTLTATNANGSNTKTVTGFITVNNTVNQTATIAASKTNICSNETVIFNFSGTNNGSLPTITWLKNGVNVGAGSTITMVGLQNGDVIRAQVTAGTSALCIGNNVALSNAITMNVTPTPPQPTITQIGGDLFSSAPSGNQWYLDGTAIPGATGNSYHPLVNGNYSVQVTINGCMSTLSNGILLKIEGISNIYPLPNNGSMTLDVFAPTGVTNLGINVYSATGEKVISEEKTVAAGLNRLTLKWNGLAAGTYNMVLLIGTEQVVKRLVIK